MASLRGAGLIWLLAATVACTDDGGAGTDPDTAGRDTADAADTAGVDRGAADTTGTDPAVDPALDPAPDPAPDLPLDAARDDAPDVPPGPCGAGGLCIPPGQECPRPLTLTQMGCTTPAGDPGGSCCILRDECWGDEDCTGCEVCELHDAIPSECVDPFTTVGPRCTSILDCPSDHCCSFSRLADRPDCGGMCVPDDEWADCHFCIGEGGQVSNDGRQCCPGLNPLPMALQAGDACIPSRCFCDTCVKRCGDGVCGTGEDPCRCPADCPHSIPKGPGAPCANDGDCAAPGTCLPQASGYPDGGYCAGGPCDPGSITDLCPAGAACTGTWFAQAYLCLPACRRDGDCRAGLTCQAFPGPYAPAGTLRCWQAGGSQPAGLGQACTLDADCLSGLCLAAPGGAKACTARCDALTPCREGLSCVGVTGCESPGCGACFTAGEAGR